MGRHSQTKGRIVINCTTAPGLYERFYALRKQARVLNSNRNLYNNREFVELMLKLVEREIVNERRRHIIVSY
jgi:hypothetical protein